MRRIFLLSLVLLLVSCVQNPTRKTQIVDDRPSLSFDLSASHMASYELKVDHLSYGSVGKYLAGKNSLKLVDGIHQIEIENDDVIVFEQTIYMGANSSKIIKVGDYE